MATFDITRIISSDQTEGRLAGFKEVIAPEMGPPMHIHPGQIEIFHIVSGRLRFQVGEETLEVGPGGHAVVPAGVAHAFKNIGEESAEIRFEMVPPGDSEEMFRRLVEEAGEHDDLNAFFDQFQIEIVGPPLE